MASFQKRHECDYIYNGRLYRYYDPYFSLRNYPKRFIRFIKVLPKGIFIIIAWNYFTIYDWYTIRKYKKRIKNLQSESLAEIFKFFEEVLSYTRKRNPGLELRGFVPN